MRNIKKSEDMAIAAVQSFEEGKYWFNQLSGKLTKSHFPYDFKKGKENEPRTNTVRLKFTGEHFSRLIMLSNGSDSRLHMILTAVLVLLLNKYTENTDIIVGIPVDKQDVEGEFINTILALRNRLEEDMTFKQLLLQVRKTIVEAAENQNYPIEALLYDLGMNFSETEFPLFDTAVVLENIQDKRYLSHVRLNMIFSLLRRDRSIEGQVHYNASRYDKKTIETITAHFTYLTGEAIINIDSPVSCIDILTGEEKKRILYDFNDTTAAYPVEETIHRLFEEQAAGTPDRIAVVGGRQAPAITYRELNEKSNRLARKLQSRGFGKGRIAALIMENSPEMAAAILAVLKAGGAYLPIDPEYPAERKKYIIEDSSAKELLVQQHLHDSHKKLFQGLSPENMFALDEEIVPAGGAADLNIAVEPDNPAYVIYTSGTTGIPKGTLTEHRGIVNYTRWRLQCYRYTKDDVTLQPLPYSFDGFGANFYSPLLSGGTLVMVPDNVKLDFNYIKEMIKDHKVTNVSLVPSMYRMLLESAGKGELKTPRFVVLAGDTSGENLVKTSKDKTPHTLLINEYGPTEITVTAAYRSGIDGLNTAVIGKPISNTRIYILNNWLKPLPVKVPGEIFVAGAGVARGYLNNPGLTVERFLDNPFSAGERMYKTGDLGRWLPDGGIEFLGRRDHQVKVRGYRVELREIESQLLKHEQIKEAVALDQEDENGDKYLAAYIVPHDNNSASVVELREYLSARLPNYMVPSRFASVAEIPLTPNGKIDRKKLLEAGGKIMSEMEYEAPRSSLEHKLVEIWADVLNLEKEVIGIHANFFQLGGHSLKVTMLVSRVSKELGVKLPLLEVFQMPTIAGLSGYIRERAEKSKYASIKPARQKEYYALSSAQKRLYILQQMDPAGTSYNIPQMFVLEGKLAKEKLQNTFNQLIKRHESLRTSFLVIEDEPVQQIHDQVDYNIQFYVLKRDPGKEGKRGDSSLPDDIVKNFVKSFDLSRAPLLRVGLVKTGEEEHILMVDIHHIISDGASHQILVREFSALYAGKELPPLRLQYKDYSEWQNSEKEREAIKAQETYWLKKFAGDIPLLDLPMDYPRPAVRSFEGNRASFVIDIDETRVLKTYAKEENSTLFMVLLAIFNVFLHKLTGQQDIIVGAPIEARNHVDLQQIIGVFINTLLLRNYPAAEKAFASFLTEVRQSTIEVFANQDYQLEDLVDRLGVSRETSRNALFDVMFGFQELGSEETGEAGLTGITVKPYGGGDKTSKFDIGLEGAEEGDRVMLSFEYCTKLFKEETVRIFIDCFKEIVSSVVQNKHIQLKEIKISHHLTAIKPEIPQMDFGF